jgi:ADP-ribose pyrophosphatase
MWKSLIKKLWGATPRSFRLRLIRATQKKFTVSVVAIIQNEEKKILLLDHFLRPGASWALPGGFIEAGEQPVDAIKREIREEAALEIENVRLLFVRTINRHIEIYFRAEASGAPRPNSREIEAAGWFSPDEMPEISRVQRQIVSEVLRSG